MRKRFQLAERYEVKKREGIFILTNQNLIKSKQIY